MMLGRNRAPEREPWPDDAPAIDAVRRNLWFSQGKGGRPTGDIDDTEYALLLAEVKGARRR